MPAYRIFNRHSATVLGVYEAATPAEALDAMARDAGYRDYRHADDVAPAVPGEIAVTLITDKESA